MKCLMCKLELFTVLPFKVRDRLKISQKEYDVYQCNSCGSIMVYPLPSFQELEKLYPQDYNFQLISEQKGLKKLLKNFEWHLFYKNIYVKNYKLISKTIGKKKFKIFDIGCGSALRLKIFKDFGCEINGNETSEACIRYAKNELGITIHKGRLEEIVKSLDKYDVVSMFALLEHLSEPAETVKIASSLLTENGYLVIQTPVMDTIQYKLLQKNAFMIKEMPRHVFVPSIRGLKTFMLGLGFEIVSYRPVSVLECASYFSSGLYDNSSAAIAYRASDLSSFCNRFIGWLLTLFPGVPVGVTEKIRGVGIETIFFFRKAK